MPTLTSITKEQTTAEIHRQRESFTASHPYLFSISFALLFVAGSLLAGSFLGSLYYVVMAAIGVVLVTKLGWWKKIGFVYAAGSWRSLLASLPAFAGVLWWLVIAPLIGYGEVEMQSLASLGIILGFTMLIGFVEEIYFRGLALQPLKSKGIWTAALVTAFLFGGAHSLNILSGASPAYTCLAGRIRCRLRHCVRCSRDGHKDDMARDFGARIDGRSFLP